MSPEPSTAPQAPPVQAPPVHAPPVPSRPAPATQPAAPEQATDTGVPARAYGWLDSGGYFARLGGGVEFPAQLLAAREIDPSRLPQPLPGVRFTELRVARRRIDLAGELQVPHVEQARVRIWLQPDGQVQLRGALRARLQIPALGSPTVRLRLDETGALSGTLEFADLDLTPRRTRMQVDGSGTLVLSNGLLGGSVQAALSYPRAGSATLSMGFSPAGEFSGRGSLQLDLPIINPLMAQIGSDAEGNLSAQAGIDATAAGSPLPGLVLHSGSFTVGYQNGRPSLTLSGFSASYADVGSLSIASLELGGRRPEYNGEGELLLTIPGLAESSVKVRVRNSAVHGEVTLGADDFPEGLPLSGGSLTIRLEDDGQLGFRGSVGVALEPAARGRLEASYEDGRFALDTELELTVPGMAPVQVRVAYADGAITGAVDVPVNTELLPGLSGAIHVEYAQDRWSGETTLDYSADDGKLSGSITVTVTQTEQDSLVVGGSGQVTAQLLPNLAGTLTATILPEGGVDVSGTIEVTEPVTLFDEKRMEKELFSHSQNIPLWAILVAVIRIRAGVRAGIGPGVFRNITVTGSYTIGATEADPSFTVSGELYIPAFVEGYVAFGAGLGLDVVLGSLTGGIEAMGTAGLYGAISVVPELAYRDGLWSIEGVATLAAGARLKLSLNAWAEIEALWVTVWENTWELASVTMPIGPDLALQARMNYVFGRPEPPELEFSSSDIDSESLIQSAMPKDGPPPTGTREALQNRAEWQGALREQRTAPVPSDLADQASAPTAAPRPARARPAPRTGRPPAAAGPRRRSGAPAPEPSPGAGATPPAGNRPGAPAGPADAAVAAAREPTDLPRTLPEEQLPTAGRPRFSGPITLRTLAEPPVPLPRSKAQERTDLNAAGTALDAAAAASASSEELASYFPRIKNRFRLASLGYEGDFHTGFDVVASINPELKRTAFAEPLRGTGLLDTAGKGHATTVHFKTANLGGSMVGTDMVADPLGPDHPIGSPPRGPQAVMDLLGDQYIRGHLLNDNLGGPGQNQNLFPITRSANAHHHNSIEHLVKKWVNEQRYWTRYTVKITDVVGPEDTGVPGEKYINAKINATASLLDQNLKPWRTVHATIDSTYNARSRPVSRETAVPAATPEQEKLRLARSVDLNATVLVGRETSTSFPVQVRTGLTKLLLNYGGWGQLRPALKRVSGIGDATVNVLQEAYRQSSAPGYDGTVTLSLSAEKRSLTLAVADWPFIMKELD